MNVRSLGPYLRHPGASAQLVKLRQRLRDPEPSTVRAVDLEKTVDLELLAAIEAGASVPVDEPARFTADIVVPVHGNARDVETLLANLDAAQSFHRGQIVLVDDGSPDERTPELLHAYARDRGDVVLVQHDSPKGVGAAMNAGIARCENDLVITLNTDIRFSPAALSKLCRPLPSGVATRTPLTSSGFLCGLGERAAGLRALFEADAGRSHDVCAALAAVPSVDLTVGTAFAMAIDRKAFDQVGGFDEKARGYGEDTRLCLMQARTGWRHILAIDTFVAHRGGSSFGPMKEKLGREASLKIATDFPKFSPAVVAYLKHDPAAAHSYAVLRALHVLAPELVSSPAPDVFEVGSQTVRFKHAASSSRR